MAEDKEPDTLEVRRMLERQAEGEALSFQSLVQEFGDFTGAPPSSDGLGGTDSLLGSPTTFTANESVADGSLLDRESLVLSGTVMGNELPAAVARRKFEEDMRVLTASGGKKTPIWLQAFFIGGLSLLLLLPIVGGSGFVTFQPWYSYVVIFLAAVTAFWATYGMVHEEEPNERWLCLIGLAMALAAATVAWLMRAPPPLY